MKRVKIKLKFYHAHKIKEVASMIYNKEKKKSRFPFEADFQHAFMSIFIWLTCIGFEWWTNTRMEDVGKHPIVEANEDE